MHIMIMFERKPDNEKPGKCEKKKKKKRLR